jgi:Ca2+-binding EF-hand superfamily protein
MYGFGGDPVAEDFLLTSELFTELDLDGDERLTKEEIAELLTIEPHFAVQITIAPPEQEAADEYGSRIVLASMRIDQDRIQSIVQHQPNRITITVGELALDIYAYDRLGRSNFQGQAEAVLAQADNDQNAYLTEEEFSAVAPQFNNAEFDGVDTDQDGHLVLDELTNFFELRTSAQRGRISVLADDQQDAMFPALDRNHDGRIDSRELANVEDSLLSLDTDGDGSVQLEELSGGMVIGVVRGANPADNVYQLPLALPGIRDDAPRWFRGMDRNQDAGISWREFLGTRAQFEELDRDDDGFVDVHEAGSASAGE